MELKTCFFTVASICLPGIPPTFIAFLQHLAMTPRAQFCINLSRHVCTCGRLHFQEMARPGLQYGSQDGGPHSQGLAC